MPCLDVEEAEDGSGGEGRGSECAGGSACAPAERVAQEEGGAVAADRDLLRGGGDEVLVGAAPLEDLEQRPQREDECFAGAAEIRGIVQSVAQEGADFLVAIVEDEEDEGGAAACEAEEGAVGDAVGLGGEEQAPGLGSVSGGEGESEGVNLGVGEDV